MVRIPAGNTTNEHYNFVVAKPLVLYKTRYEIFEMIYATITKNMPEIQQNFGPVLQQKCRS